MSFKNRIVSDSSFYICFLDDITEHQCLLRILSNFNFFVTPLVHEELKESKNYKVISNKNCFNTITGIDKFSEILKPFFSKEEILRGEHEVIAVAYFLYQFQIDFYFILDDSDGRNYVKNNFGYLGNLMFGTIGFIGMCFCTFRCLYKEEVFTLLNEI